jgi:hypothetical protein
MLYSIFHQPSLKVLVYLQTLQTYVLELAIYWVERAFLPDIDLWIIVGYLFQIMILFLISSGSIIAMVMMDKLGRKVLLTGSFFGMVRKKKCGGKIAIYFIFLKIMSIM